MPLSFALPEELEEWRTWVKSHRKQEPGLWMLKTGQDAGTCRTECSLWRDGRAEGVGQGAQKTAGRSVHAQDRAGCRWVSHSVVNTVFMAGWKSGGHGSSCIEEMILVCGCSRQGRTQVGVVRGAEFVM